MHGPAVRPFESLGGLPLHNMKGQGTAASRHTDVSQRMESPNKFDDWPVYLSTWVSLACTKTFGEPAERGGQAWVSVIMTVDFVSLLHPYRSLKVLYQKLIGQ